MPLLFVAGFNSIEKMTKRFFLILSLNILCVHLLVAQKELTGMGVRSDVIEVKNGRKHFVHIVKARETLYSISKTYHIPMQDIASVNNDMLVTIRLGQKLYIPAKPISPEDDGANYFFFFVAEEDMSLYKASQHYKFQINEFLKLNPSAQKGIKRGEIIKVPKERTVITEEIIKDSLVIVNPIDLDIKASCRDFVYNKNEHTFHVAMLLPLFLEKNDKVLQMSESSLARANFDRKTSQFIEYVQGVLMAADQLRKEGLNVDLTIYDTRNDSTRVQQLLKMGVVDDVDLVVGPVYSTHYLTVSEYLKEKEVNLVSPLAKKTRLISNNHNSFLLTPSNKTLFEALSYFIAKDENVSNVLLLHNGKKKEIEYAGVFKEQFAKGLNEQEILSTPSFKMINYRLGGVKSVESELDSVIPNVVVIPSNDEVFVTDIVAKLNVLGLRYPVKLVGLEVWENYPNLSLSNLHNLNFHYATQTFVNYEDPRVKRFVQFYRLLFKAEPSDYAFRAHDAFLYYGQALKRFGKHFNYCLGSEGILPNRTGLCTEWNFEQLDEFSGYENKTTYLIRYKDGVDVDVHKVIMKADGAMSEEIRFEEEIEENE